METLEEESRTERRHHQKKKKKLEEKCVRVSRHTKVLKQNESNENDNG